MRASTTRRTSTRIEPFAMTDTGASHPLHLLALARREFERRLPGAPDRLDAATPCEGWNVRDLLQHVVVGNRVTVVTLQGATRDEIVATREALAGGDVLGDDPVAAFVDSADAQAAAFAQPGALERVCHHGLGDIPGAQVLPFRVGDLTLHAWDLARATSTTRSIPPSSRTCTPRWRRRRNGSLRAAGSARARAATCPTTRRCNSASST